MIYPSVYAGPPHRFRLVGAGPSLDDTHGGSGGDGGIGDGGEAETAGTAGTAAGEDRCIWGHRAILVHRSSRLRALLTSGYRESEEEEICLYGALDAEGMERELMVALFQYIYSGVITPGTSPDMLLKLAVLANEYMMTRLVVMCEGELVRLVDDDNATDLLQYAQHFRLEHLRQGCDLYICRRLSVLEAAGRLDALDPEAQARVRRAVLGVEPPDSAPSPVQGGSVALVAGGAAVDVSGTADADADAGDAVSTATAAMGALTVEDAGDNGGDAGNAGNAGDADESDE